MKMLLCSVFAGLVVFGPIATANAGVHVRVPFVSVDVNGYYPGVYVRAPFVRYYSPMDPPVVYYSDPVYVEPVRPATVNAVTLQDFARDFQPTHGVHEAVFLHPSTQQAVRVRFRLPPGQPEEVKAEKNKIVFEYDDREVEIHFKRNGSVAVTYDD